MKIKTLTSGAGVQTEVVLNYLPEKIVYSAATQLTGLKVEVLGEGVICDLDASGLTAVGRIGMLGVPSNTYVLTLADGKILNKNVVLTFTNSAAQTPDVFAFGDSKGSAYVKSVRAKVYANTNAEFTNFAFLAAPSLAAGDKVTCTFEDDLTDILERDDLQARCTMFQNTPSYSLHNLDGTVKKAQILGASDQTVYMVYFQPV